MKQIRLLPIVIVAGTALLLLKGLGIMTGGGYVLTGASQVRAASGEATMSMPAEPTMVDKSPTLDDGAPTLSVSDPSAVEHGAGTDEAVEDEASAEGETADAGATGEAADVVVPSMDEADQAVAEAQAEAESETSATACPEADQSVIFNSPDGGCLPPAGEQGDAVAMERGEDGVPVPLDQDEAGVGSEKDVLERLAERRDQLDAREAELDMRLALVEAAEKRVAERTAALEVLEARINALVDEKRVLEEKQFTALVAMYETMKPKDAAAIFDELESDVLLRVARAISPRKMGPIMAKMDPLKAKDLTAGLAVDQVEPTIDLSGEDLSSLPQIVGQ